MALYSPYFMRWTMKPVKNKFCLDYPLNLQEDLPPSLHFGDLRRAWWRPKGVSSRCLSPFFGGGGGCPRPRGRRRVELVETSRGCLRVCWRRVLSLSFNQRFDFFQHRFQIWGVCRNDFVFPIVFVMRRSGQVWKVLRVVVPKNQYAV